jgi:hypothetical protein
MAISISAIENEGIRLAITLAVTGPPISSWMNLIASRTKSIFHRGKVGRRRAFIPASTGYHARVDGLGPLYNLAATDRQAILWEQPSRALPGLEDLDEAH